MLQATKNKYCKETFLRLNQWYSRIHGLAAEDIEKVNAMVEHIEMTRSDRQPKVGDRLVFVSLYGERSRPFFIDAVYGESVSLRKFSCVPFVSRNEEGIQSDMPGGECVLAETGKWYSRHGPPTVSNIGGGTGCLKTGQSTMTRKPDCGNS